MSESSSNPKAKTLSARLFAVQAFFQIMQNKQAVAIVYQEFMDHRFDEEVDGQKLVPPDAALFKTIIYGVHERHVEVESIVTANLRKDASDRVVEPLLKSILMCGVYEILVQEDIDAPILINDYLNVGHAFYEKNEVALVNGVLDSVAKMLRG